MADPRWLALALALAIALAGPRAWRTPAWHRASRWLAPLAAAALSLGYVHHYLRGGPRIIDATAYLLQARALSHGMLAFPVEEPLTATLGRFLLAHADPAGPTASVIFPPGYPAVLALGVALGAPMGIGPLIAAALVAATMTLARAVSAGFSDRRLAEGTVTLAGWLSCVCAALRYHTADTMAHGWAALCTIVGLSAALAALARGRAAPAAVAGLALGWLFATRPASALALGATLGLALWQAPRRATPRQAAVFALAALPPLALWLAHQHAATGHWLGSAQLEYYARSDGPPGCFRYGFGAGIGCLGEHGEFVRHNLPDGYGAYAALATTARRLKHHLADPLDTTPLLSLVVLGAVCARRLKELFPLVFAIFAQVMSYAPFYFDGNYPGGGARMLAEVLPLEHVLAAVGAAALAGRVPIGRLASAVLALALAGFAVETAPAHEALRAREGGRPMWEASLAAPAFADDPRAVVFVATDHGFGLGFDPGRPRVARWHGDDLDRLVWEAHERPPAYRYLFGWQPHAPARPRLERVSFDPRPTAALSLTIEGESLWPPARQRGGWAWPSYDVPDCASADRALVLTPTGGHAEVEVALPAALAGRMLRPRVVGWTAPAALSLVAAGAVVHRWSAPSGSPACVELAAAPVPESPALALVLASDAAAGLDALVAEPPQKR